MASPQHEDTIGVIDIDVWCQCPPMWHGVIPPYCPVHNPGSGRTWSSGELRYALGFPPRLSDEDVARIADAVAERMKPKRKKAKK